MRDGGAEKRWRDLADGDKSGKDGHAGEPTVIYDVRGRVVATLSSEAVKLKDVAPAMWQAIVATEDHRFFQHKGVDLRGLLRAVGSLGRRGGGSTITQQLVKNLVLSQDRTISRKAAEILLSLQIEKRLTKDELLEAYLNNVYWGHGVYGIAAAAASYYGKTPRTVGRGRGGAPRRAITRPGGAQPVRQPRRRPPRSIGGARVHGQARIPRGRAGEKIRRRAAPRRSRLRPPTDVERSAGLEGSASDVGGVYTGGRGVPRLGRGSAAPYRAPFFVSEVLYHLKELFHGEDVLATGG